MIIDSSLAVMVVMVINCCVWFEQKKSVMRDFKGGGGNSSILKHPYLNDCAQFDIICLNMIVFWPVKYLW